MLLFIDGFDHYTNVTGGQNFDTVNGGIYVTPLDFVSIDTMPVLGTNCIRGTTGGFGGAGNYAVRKSLASYTTGSLGAGFHVYFVNASDSRLPAFFSFSSATGDTLYQLSLSAYGGVMQLRSGTGTGSVIASGTTAIAHNTLYHIEVKIDIANAGSIEVRLNGVSEILWTGDTNNTPIAQIGLVLRDGNDCARSTYIDNLYIWDSTGSVNNNWLGERTVQTIVPDGDTAEADWAKSSGSVGYTLINDIPPVDAEYITSNTIGDVSEFTMSALADSNILPIGVSVMIRGQKTASGVAKVSFGLNDGTTIDMSPDVDLSNGQFSNHRFISELNPTTGLPWTALELGNVKIRLESA